MSEKPTPIPDPERSEGEGPVASKEVGPVLENSPQAQCVIKALHADNKGLTILDRGAYLRVKMAERCVLKRATVEKICGFQFRLPSDLEKLMPSFKGRLTMDEEQAVWTWE